MVTTDQELGKNLPGYFDLRGQKIVLYDLAGFLGISMAEGFEVIISEIMTKNIGFLVTKVSGIISAEDIKPFPEIVKAKDYFRGVVKDEDDLLQVLSFARLLSGSRLNAVKKLLESQS
jgi:chemotaxis signal transduction protein